MIKAFRGHVIVKNLEESKESPSGLITSTIQRKKMMGVVTDSALGDIPVGTFIVYGRCAGKELKHEGEEYRKIAGDDILAITNGTWDDVSPVSDYLLVEPFEQKQSEIIYVPNKAKEADDYSWAKVIRVGPGRILRSNNKLLKTTVKEGDRILYGPYCSYALKKYGSNLVLVRESDVELVCSE